MCVLIQLQNSNWFRKKNKEMLTLTSIKQTIDVKTTINISKTKPKTNYT